MRSSVLLWSAIFRMAQQTMSAWRAGVVGMMLCLMVVAGCDVRPFNELLGEDTAEENGADDGETDDGETPDTEPLELTATPPEIETPENTPAQPVQVTVVNPDPARTYTFAISTPPTNGDAEIDPNTGSLSFTPNTDFSDTDSLVVTVTDDSEPARSGSIPIPITVNPG